MILCQSFPDPSIPDNLIPGRRRRAALIAAMLLVMLLPATSWAGGLGQNLSFTDLTAKEDATAFYADGGKRHVGKRVHIHVPASCIHEKPLRTLFTTSGLRYLVFKNRNVPIAARAQDVYLRKARQRTTKKDTLCVKGTVVQDGPANSSGYVIRVSRLTKAP